MRKRTQPGVPSRGHRRGRRALAPARAAGWLLLASLLGCSPDAHTDPDGTATAPGPTRPSSAAEPLPDSVQGAPAPSVASLSPLASRFLLAVGAGPQIVAVDAESQQLDGLSHAPVVDLHGAAGSEPQLVVVAELPPPDDPTRLALEASGARILAFAPHDIEDVMALIQDVGSAVVGYVRAMRYETVLTRPLAEIGGASFGRPRPRVLAVVGFDPLAVAGGHSFETDLIEIAGGHSVTHPGEATRLELEPDEWKDLAPDLLVVMDARTRSPEERATARARLPSEIPVEFFRFDAPTFWLDEPTRDARRLFDLLEPYSAAMPRVEPGATPPRS